MPKDNTPPDKTGTTDFTGDISRTLNDAMVTSMAECFAIQQGIMNVPIFNGKNIPFPYAWKKFFFHERLH